MPTNTSGGTTASFFNTPQATDNCYTADEDGVYTFDVMADDLGGSAKILWSIDDNDLYGTTTTSADGTTTTTTNVDSVIDLTVKDVAGAAERSFLGASIWIENGKVKYDASALDWLAEDETATDYFTYAIRLSNGTLSGATVKITITGTNDGPVAVADTGSAGENEGKAFAVVANDTDVDDGAVLTLVSIDGVTVGGDPASPAEAGAFGISGNNIQFTPGTAFDHLAAGATATVVVSYTIKDQHGAPASSTLTLTVTGTNDAALFSGDQGGIITEDDVPNTVIGDLNSTDVDGTDNSFVAVTTATTSDSGYGTFTVTADGQWTYVLDNSNPAVDELFDFSQFLYDTFTITAADGTTTVIDITIFGNNDPALITGDTEGVVVEATPADPGVPSDSGDLNSTDVDGAADDFFEITTPTLSVNGYGYFTITDTGVWTYTLDNTNPTVDDLDDDEPLSDSFVVHTQDGTAQTITVTINGATDAVVKADVYTDDDDPNNFDTKTETATITGTNGDDLALNGNNSANVILALGGNDTVNAGGGGDTVYGGNGVDIINGGAGNDDLYGQAGNDFIHGDGNSDEIWGGSGNDQIFGDDMSDQTLWGGSGSDTINGGDNADRIAGGFGADELTGGTNSDIFVYVDVRDRGDTITDFSGGDRIDLTAIDANPLFQAGDQGFEFGDTTATAHGVWYEHDDDGNTLVYVDTDGNVGTAELWLKLTGTVTLDQGDFLLGP